MSVKQGGRMKAEGGSKKQKRWVLSFLSSFIPHPSSLLFEKQGLTTESLARES
jgi:hypothetical protein